MGAKKLDKSKAERREELICKAEFFERMANNPEWSERSRRNAAKWAKTLREFIKTGE